jgi:SAM-dependent methyltransferase
MSSATTAWADPAFDQYAAEYDAALHQGLSVSGEGRAYFADGRVSWLAGCLRELGHRPRAVLDFGCGTGDTVPLLLDRLGAERAVGVDVSEKSLQVARRSVPRENVTFTPLDDYRPAGDMDLAYCNGVFHHIPVDERAAALDFVRRALRPGGLFALWENNPWNPGTRYVMSRIPFDKDAITLTPPETRRLLRAGGFAVVRTDYRFIFPRALRALRALEGRLARLPFGAQYQVLARKV